MTKQTKKQICESKATVAYYSGLGGLETKYIEYGIVFIFPCDAGRQFFGVAVYGYIAAPLPQPAQKLCGQGNAVPFREFLEHGGGDEFACFEVCFRFVEPLLFSEFFFGVLLCDALLLGGSFLFFLRLNI